MRGAADVPPANLMTPKPPASAHSTRSRKPQKKAAASGVLFGVGALLGHVIKGVKTPVTPKPRVVHEEVIEQPVDLPQGRVVLRRTVRDEVVPVPPAKNRPKSPGA